MTAPAPMDSDTIVPMRWPMRWLFALRFLLAGGYLLALGYLIVLCAEWTGDPLAALLLGTERVSPVFLSIPLAILLQSLFLAGAPHLKWPRPRSRRSMAVSKAIAAMIAALISLGILCAVLSLFDLGGDWIRPMGWTAWGRRFAWVFELQVPVRVRLLAHPLIWFWLGAWGFWAVIFLVVWAGEWVAVFRRIYRLLLAGSVLELLITIPIDIQIRKRTHCYCAEGSFFAMAVGLTVIPWLFGPGIVLLFYARRMQRRPAFQVCRKCGYDLRGLPEPRCPECGTPFTPQ